MILTSNHAHDIEARSFLDRAFFLFMLKEVKPIMRPASMKGLRIVSAIE